MPFIRSLLVLVGLAGCADMSLTKAEAMDAGGTETDVLDGSEDTGSLDESPAPTLWTVGGDLVLDDGFPRATTSTLDVALLDDLDQVVCESETTPLESVDALASPDASVFTWWSVTLPALSGPCDVLPATVRLGIGAFHPALEPYLVGMEGLADDAASSLNAAYLSQDDGKTVWVYGIAGSADAFAGLSSPAALADDLNGEWRIVPVFPLPVPAT